MEIENDVTLQVYKFVKAYIREHTHPPTLREIAVGCYLARSTAAYHLQKLEHKGYIRREPGRARGLTLLERDK